MPIEPQEFAHMLGAEIVGEVPEVGGGPFGMARLARILQEHLTPSQGARPGRPTNPSWEVRPKVPMSTATFHQLTRIAQEMSTADRQVSPMQVAAQLLEEAVSRLSANPSACPEGGEDPSANAADKAKKVRPSQAKQASGHARRRRRRQA